MISVIVPIFNGEFFLCDCLDSIMNQTYRDLEILLIDDGSTDHSKTICHRYCKKDNRFQYYYQNNEGEASARNRGLKIAKGDYIAFIDCDDIVNKRYLEYLYRAIKEGEYFISMVKYQESKEIIKKNIHKFIPYKKVLLSTEEYIKNLYLSLTKGEINNLPLGVVWGKLYKRQLLLNFEFKPLKISTDIEFSVRICRKLGDIVIVPYKMYWWRNHYDSLSHNNDLSEQKLYSILYLWIEILKNTLPNSDDSLKYRALCLVELYRKIHLVRFYTYKKNLEIYRFCNKLGKQYLSVLIKDKKIRFIKKCEIIFLFNCPYVYKIIRNLLVKN